MTVHHWGLALIKRLFWYVPIMTLGQMCLQQRMEKMNYYYYYHYYYCVTYSSPNLKLYHSPPPKQLHVNNIGPFLKSSQFNASRLAGLAVSRKVMKEIHSVGYQFQLSNDSGYRKQDIDCIILGGLIQMSQESFFFVLYLIIKKPHIL